MQCFFLIEYPVVDSFLFDKILDNLDTVFKVGIYFLLGESDIVGVIWVSGHIVVILPAEIVYDRILIAEHYILIVINIRIAIPERPQHASHQAHVLGISRV